MEDKNISINEENTEVLLDGATQETVKNEATEAEVVVTEVADAEANAADTEAPLDKNVKLMSPMQMVIRRFFRSSAEAISRRGRAKANDRTMLDALLHAADAMEQCQTDDVVQLLKAGWEGACRGAEATKQMLPRLGRSKNFRTHVLGYPDPGAVSTSIIFQGLYEAVSNENAK